MKRMKHPVHGWTHAYDPHQEAYLRGLGWGDDVPEVVAPPPMEDIPSSDWTLQTLRDELTQRGIAFDKRWGLERLKSLLE